MASYTRAHELYGDSDDGAREPSVDRSTHTHTQAHRTRTRTSENQRRKWRQSNAANARIAGTIKRRWCTGFGNRKLRLTNCNWMMLCCAWLCACVYVCLLTQEECAPDETHGHVEKYRRRTRNGKSLQCTNNNRPINFHGVSVMCAFAFSQKTMHRPHPSEFRSTDEWKMSGEWCDFEIDSFSISNQTFYFPNSSLRSHATHWISVCGATQ